MRDIPWAKEFPGNITVCDGEGVILEMNDRAAASFAKDGGHELIGTNLLDCHGEPSRTKVKDLLASGQVNAYITEKDGAKKLIYQAHWHEDGEYRGLVEVSLPLPDPLPHFVRDTTK